ncbi:MAG: PHP domain-containing protein [Firmicutes bacterium]|nr:PHP domain-containing protein [Bacillota bacterium]
MSMRIDLHVHSTASDGTLSPAEVVRDALDQGVSVLALTDHDSMDGVPEAVDAAARLGVQLIPGVELNTDVDAGEVHILGYFIPLDSEWFQALLASRRRARVERGEKMVRRLRELGCDISFDAVKRLARGGAITRPHVARALVEAGYARSVEDAFARYLYTGGPAYVKRENFTPEEAVKAVLKAGGVPVLAHPGRLSDEGIIPGLLAAGLQGLECYYPEHTPEQTDRFLALANEHDLVVTGGTDAHGPGSRHERRIGSVSAPADVVERLMERKARLALRRAT